MSKRVQMLAAGVLLCLAVAAVLPLGAGADEPAGLGPVFKHGLELRVRKAGEPDFNDKTKKVGVELFLDGPNGNGVYIGDAGDLATVAAKLVAPEESKVKAPEWSHGMELRGVMPARRSSPRTPGSTASRCSWMKIMAITCTCARLARWTPSRARSGRRKSVRA